MILLRIFILYLCFLFTSCATNVVKKDFGSKNTYQTSAAFSLDTVATYALISNPQSSIVTFGYLYGFYAIFYYGEFMLLRPDTHWLSADTVFKTSDLRGTIILRKNGQAEFIFGDPNPIGEWTDLCRRHNRCSYGYGIHASGWIPLGVSFMEPEGWSGNFHLDEDILIWRKPDGTILEFHKQLQK